MPRVRLELDQVRRLPVTHCATIPDDYLDAMGHMNVMWYTHLFSMGMGGLLQIIGLPWEKMTESQTGTFALETHIRYLAEVRVGQSVEIHVRVLGRTLTRYHTLQIMTNQTNQNVAATYESVTAFVDLKHRRMAPMPDQLASGLDQLIEDQKTLDWDPPVCGSMRP